MSAAGTDPYDHNLEAKAVGAIYSIFHSSRCYGSNIQELIRLHMEKLQEIIKSFNPALISYNLEVFDALYAKVVQLRSDVRNPPGEPAGNALYDQVVYFLGLCKKRRKRIQELHRQFP